MQLYILTPVSQKEVCIPNFFNSVNTIQTFIFIAVNYVLNYFNVVLAPGIFSNKGQALIMWSATL